MTTLRFCRDIDEWVDECPACTSPDLCADIDDARERAEDARTGWKVR